MGGTQKRVNRRYAERLPGKGLLEFTYELLCNTNTERLAFITIMALSIVFDPDGINCRLSLFCLRDYLYAL